MDKINNQEMLMDWEIQMIDEISKKVDIEIDEENKELARSHIFISDLFGTRRQGKIDEEISKYRKQHTLGILASCGLDLSEFEKSSLNNEYNTNLLLNHIQGKIDGYDLDLTVWVDEVTLASAVNVPKRIPNYHSLDVNRMLCTLENDTLIIEVDGERYEYKQDEHYLIYLNGEVILTDEEIPTDEEIMESVKNDHERLHKNLEDSRLSREYSYQKTLDDSSRYWVK